MKTNTFLLYCFLIIFMSCQKNDVPVQTPYNLDKWLGEYEGTSHHWSSYPAQINGQWQFVTIQSYKKVKVDVLKSISDSSLNLNITYNDTIINSHNNVKIARSGDHFSDWGGGSGYGSLSVKFYFDSLNYKLFQACGIPCQSGIDFCIKKK